MIHSVLFCLFLSLFYSCNVVATAGLGEVAQGIYEPISIVIQLVRAVSIISGSGLILGSLIRYRDYRRNPVAVRLSSVLFMFIFGSALILVGLIPFKG